jgi:hypothetical protein
MHPRDVKIKVSLNLKFDFNINKIFAYIWFVFKNKCSLEVYLNQVL